MRLGISAALGCLLCATVHAAPALNNPTSEVLSESSSGAVIAVEIPEATLSVLNRGESGDAIAVEIPGTIPDFDQAGVVLPSITKLLEVPEGYRVAARVKNARMREYSIDAMIPRDGMERVLRKTEEPAAVEVGEPGWMRWLRVAPVVIRPAQYDPTTNTVQVAERMELEFEFIPDGNAGRLAPDPDRYWSLDFADFFDTMLLNPRIQRNILPGGQVITRGSYLIITDSTLANFTSAFADWKRAKGFNVVVAPIYYRGISADEIRAYIRDAYENWPRPPEYVLLLGDANASIELPTFFIRNPFPGLNEIDPTDLPYGLIQDEDYFPDIFIGRVSSDSPNSTIAQNFFIRLIRHERDPLGFPADAFSRAVVYAGNRGDGGDVVLSPVETSEWLAQRPREKG